MDNNNKPKHYFIFKLAGLAGILISVVGFILLFTGFGNFENDNFMIGGFVLMFGLPMSFIGITIGFGPEIYKMGTQSVKYMQRENKQDLKDISNDAIEIREEAITRATRAMKKGLVDDQMFCKHCGAEIDADSSFCKKCGKQQ